MRSKTKGIIIFLAAISILILPVFADRTTVRPGWNLFTPQQDTEIGRQLAKEAEGILPFIDQNNANAYIGALGQQLSVHAPGEKYTYQFKIVDDANIDAFALPGGFIYVSRGLIEAAQNEPELAGMLAHQIGHVSLRHGTQELSNAYAEEAPNATPGRVSVRAVMSRLDVTFDRDSIVLKSSREEERQADLIATQILVDSSFDPRQMTQFFQRIGNERSNLTEAFFKGHPNLPNRVARVRAEMQNMGGLPRKLRGDSPDFHSVKERLMAANMAPVIDADRNVGSTPDLPSSRMLTYRGNDFQFRYPENWQVYEEGQALSVAPDGGIVSGSLAYGMRIATFEPQNTSYFGQKGLTTPSPIDRAGRSPLARATDQLLDDLKRSNPNMRTVRSDERRRVDGQPGMTIEMTNDSPLGGREVNWLVTVLRPNGMLYYFVGVATQRDFNRYASTFEQMVASVRFTE